MHHFIVMNLAPDYRSRAYGVLYTSRNVYQTNTSHSPTRLEVWNNIGRLNPRNGEPVRYGNYGPIDGGNGKYLNPRNIATDDDFTILITTESTVMCSSPDLNTGHPDSGQVYAKDESGRPVVIRDGDTATLSIPDGTTERIAIHLPPHSNGHGHATFT